LFSLCKAARTALLVTLIAMGLTVVDRATAQLGFIPRFRIKAGVFLPQNTSLQNAVGNTWFKIGADVNVPFSLVPLGSARVGIEYAVNGSSNIVPITLTQVIQPSVGVHSPLYFGAGIGLWTGHIRGRGTDTRFGFRLLGGLEFTSRLFLELQYDFVGRMGDTHVDGLSVLVGTKF